MIGRREFIPLLGGAVAAWPLAARAQQADRVRRVGILMDLAEQDGRTDSCRGLPERAARNLGWTEGRNVKFDTRWTAGDPARMRRYAVELVGLAPEVIMNGGLPTLVAMQQETRTIPVVFAQVLDPVGGRICRKPVAPRREYHRICQLRIQHGGQMVGDAKAHGASHRSHSSRRSRSRFPVEMGMLGAIQAVIPAFAMQFIAVGGLTPRISNGASNSSRGSRMAASSFCRVPTPWFTGTRSWPRRPPQPACDLPVRVFCSRRCGLLSYGIVPADNFRRAAAYSKAQIQGSCRSKSRPNLDSCSRSQDCQITRPLKFHRSCSQLLTS